MMNHVPLTSTSLHCCAGFHRCKYHSAECSEMCVYKIKQSMCERLPKLFQMVDGWVQRPGDQGAEAESMCGSCITGGCDPDGEVVRMELWEELPGVG